MFLMIKEMFERVLGTSTMILGGLAGKKLQDVWTRHIVALSLLMAGTVYGQPDTGNLIYNSSFEEGTITPSGWMIRDEDGAQHTAELDHSQPRLGTRSWKVTRTNPQGGRQGGWYSLYPTFVTGESSVGREGDPTHTASVHGVTADALLREGQTFTCTFWYRSAASDSARIHVQVAWDNWKKYRGSPQYPPSSEWRRVSFTFTVPSGVKKLDCFRIPVVQAIQGDTFWVDGFRLQQGSESTAPVSNADTEMWLSSKSDSFDDEIRFVLHAVSPAERPACSAVVSVINSAGRTVSQHKQEVGLHRGANALPLSLKVGDCPEGPYRVDVALVDADRVVLDRMLDIKVEKVSVAAIKDKMKSLEAPLAKLKELVRQARAKGMDTAYQDIAVVLAEDFLTYANDDIKTGQIKFARYIANYLLESVTRAETELRQAFEHPSKQRAVPTPSMMANQMRVNRGAFYSGNQPVLLFGPCHYKQAYKDMPKMARYGFNSFELTQAGEPLNALDISAFFRDSEQVCTQTVTNDHYWLDRCEQHNLAGVVCGGTNYLPRWFLERYPEVCFPGVSIEETMGKGWLGPVPHYIIDHPEVEKLHELYWRALAQTYSGKAGFHSYILANEPMFMRSADNPFALKRFQSWLKDKYGAVQNLNARWNKEYKDFEEVAFSDCQGSSQNRASWYDWVVFNWSRGTELFSSAKKIIRQYDKKSPIHIKIMNTPAITEAFRINRGGLNREDIATKGEDGVVGCDGRFMYQPPGGDYINAPSIWPQIFSYDFLKSIAPDCPIMDSEWHFLRGNPPGNYSPEYIRTAMWESCLHGVGGIYFWLWDRIRATGRPHFSECGLTVDPAITETIGRTSLDLRRLAKYVVEFPRLKAELRILYSYPSIIQQGQNYLAEVEKAYKASFFLGLPVRFITEKQIGRKQWSGCKLLIVPDARYVSDECFGAIRQFAKDGGTVVLIGTPLKFNEYGDSRREQIGSLPGILRLENPPSSLMEYSDLVSKWLDAAKIDRPLKVMEADTGKNAFGVEARLAEVNQEHILYVVNWNSKPTEVVIEIHGKKPKFVSLIDGKRIGNRIALAPLDLYLLKQSGFHSKAPQRRRKY